MPRLIRFVLPMAFLGAVAFTAGACGKPAPPPKKTAPDREVLQDVNGAVNAVIRSSDDCDTARPLIKTAYERIEWARGQLELPGSQESLSMQKAQLDRYAQLCPQP